MLFITTGNIFAKTGFGILAGMSNSTFISKNVTTGQDYVVIKMPNSDYGIHLGGFFQFKKSLLLIQPELYFSTISNTYKITEPLSAGNAIYKNDRSFNCELPLLIGIKTGILTIKAGPSGRYVIFSGDQLKKFTGYDVTLKKAMWSLNSGIGLQIMKFQLNLAYEFGLSKIADGITVDGKKRSFDSRANQFIVNVGWMF